MWYIPPDCPFKKQEATLAQFDQGLIVIYPVPHDLARDEHGTPICGPNTAKACDEAIAYARSHGLEKCILLFTATNDGSLWDGRKMGRIMEEYVAAKEPDILTHYTEARSFNTFGEVGAIARFFIGRLRHSKPLDSLVLIVKDWHARRLKLIVETVFRKYNLTVPYDIRSHVAPVKSKHQKLESLKTALVFVQGLLYHPGTD